MEKETIEKVAERLYSGIDRQVDRMLFINGAKWQQERMYSDMQEYAEFCIRCYEKGINCVIAEDWFKQFKKENNGK